MKVAQRPKQRSELFNKYATRLPDIIRCGISAAPKGRYLHWDKLRHLTPPCDLNHEEWWLGVKFARSGMYRTLPLKDVAGQPFSFTMPDIVQEKVIDALQDALQEAKRNIPHFTYVEEVDVTDDAEFEALTRRTGWKTVPQVFINDQLIGGFTELQNLAKSGELDKKLQG